MKINSNNVTFRECSIDSLDEIFNIQQIMFDTQKKHEKNYYIPDSKDYIKKILDKENNLGWFYGAYYNNQMIGFICLSIAPKVKLLADMVDGIKGTYADIGTIVLPEYRGNGIQLLMLDFLEKEAKIKSINNLLAEITYGNSYSLNNFLKMNYTIVNNYKRDGYIDRHILQKKIM